MNNLMFKYVTSFLIFQYSVFIEMGRANKNLATKVVKFESSPLSRLESTVTLESPQGRQLFDDFFDGKVRP